MDVYPYAYAHAYEVLLSAEIPFHSIGTCVAFHHCAFFCALPAAPGVNNCQTKWNHTIKIGNLLVMHTSFIYNADHFNIKWTIKHIFTHYYLKGFAKKHYNMLLQT